MTDTAAATANAAANPWEEALIADLRANGGRPSSGPLAGHPLLLMWSRGAKTGQERRSILTYTREGDDYIVAGTKSGAPTDPAWVANVEKTPTVRLEIAGHTTQASATVERTGPERDRLWKAHVEGLPWFGKYEATTERVIPIVRLRPIAG
jgi:deazaflavin-dependent oxidoreductase (nitroreductase family)